MTRLRRRLAAAHDRGASAVEYALLIAAIGAVIVGVAFTLGGRIKSAVDSASTCVVAQGVGCASAGPTAGPTSAPTPSSTRGSGSGNNGNGNNGNGNGNGGGNSHNGDD